MWNSEPPAMRDIEPVELDARDDVSYTDTGRRYPRTARVIELPTRTIPSQREGDAA
ncbi:hypothetical protein ACGFZR_15510 [Streptomyces sp. NPDC048241]|uniref:hypothetical protein n=1 Tax=Streptomyces sp. NPDC048241 TaxID=3365521 RepID=UPI0037156E00